MHVTSEMEIADILVQLTQRPELPGLLDDLMWISQVECGAYRHLVKGIVKPDMNLTGTAELRAQLCASYNEIIRRLEDSGMIFWSMPELEIKGTAYGCNRRGCDCNTKRGFRAIEATVRIELYP
jgi:hypothetical protein